jgi:nucleoside-diphosphate-sugar epimerase
MALASHRDLFYRPWWRETIFTLVLFGELFQYWADTREQNMFLGTALMLYLLKPADVPGLSLWKFGHGKYIKEANSLVDHNFTWEQALKGIPGANIPTGERYAVVGGAGFVGRRIVQFLLHRGERDIVVIDMDSKGLQDLANSVGDNNGKKSIQTIVADVTNLVQITSALQNVQCVFAPFAAIRYWESLPQHLYRSSRINVEGAKTLVQACLDVGVKRLIATSTGNVMLVRPGIEPARMDESFPYATSSTGLHNYAISKSLGEQVYLSANCEKLAVSVIRPCSNVYGHRDKTWFDVATKGSTLVMDTSVPIDWVHADDIVLAEMLAETRLRNGWKDAAAGESFNVTGGPPITYGAFQFVMQQEAQRVGLKCKPVKLPVRLITIIAHVVDCLQLIFPGDLSKWLGQLGTLTTATVNSATALDLCSDDKAREILTYKPRRSFRMWARSTWQEYVQNRAIME